MHMRRAACLGAPPLNCGVMRQMDGSMADAICVKCGGPKRQAWSRCRRCAFDPSVDDENLVRSVYLSVGRFDDEVAADAYRRELDSIGAALQAGQTIAFHEDELVRLRAQKATLDSIPVSAVWMTILVKIVLPAVLFIGGLLAVKYTIRLLM
jgi:hypothetical protein